jgi:hypothetical protein
MTPTYRELDTVVLTRDLPEAGLRAGDLGAVVLVYGPERAPEALEVEFVTAAGRTQALRTLGPGDVRPVRDDDLLAVRPAAPARSAA